MSSEDYFDDVLSLNVDCSDIATDDDLSDSDDDINVIIDAQAIKDRPNRIDEYKLIQQFLNNAKIEDDELQVEIELLVTKSIESPMMHKHITVFVDNRYLIVDYNTKISDRLKSYIWHTSKPYLYKPLIYIDSLNNFIKPNASLPDVYAVFSVKYDRVNNVKSQKFNNIKTQQMIKHKYRFQNNNALYIYIDFSILIIKDGKIVDYAIHGIHSSIRETVDRWKPSQIIYNAEPNDPLDTFLHYEHQPFYELIYKYGKPMKLFRNQKIVCLALCERNDVYCAFCNGLKDLLGLTNFYYQSLQHQQNHVDAGKEIRFNKRQHKYNRRFNPYRQPTIKRHSLTVLKNM